MVSQHRWICVQSVFSEFKYVYLNVLSNVIIYKYLQVESAQICFSIMKTIIICPGLLNIDD